MESMLNKLKSTVTKVTADVTSAVMGNPVTREFEVGRHIASGGPGLCWRIYHGTKKSTKQEVAVFVFDKKIIDKYQKFDKDQVVDSLKRGISEGLTFLHSGVKMVHGNLCLENIILNKSGAWKIMGFDFSISSINPSDAEYKCKEWEPSLPALCLPHPEYLAPEYILSVSCDSASDMYSLGVIMHAVFNDGKPVFTVNQHDIFKSFSRQLDQLSSMSGTMLNKIPEEVRDHVKMLLSVTPNVPFFDDVGAMTLQYFDSLFQRDNLQKSQFFKGLPKVLPKLPKRVVVYRILPVLTGEFVNPDMVPFVLPNELCLNIIPTFANLIDYPSMKNSLIPRIKSACLQTSSLALIPSREPAVLMGVLGIYKCTFTHKKLGIPKEHLASNSTPSWWSSGRC
ncbi:hypothetical protein CRUP_028232 [Coryphaenoides rupestris]|nr:hypothetical protein CRUP_028232 [Coryphaenoides rupestris]